MEPVPECCLGVSSAKAVLVAKRCLCFLYSDEINLPQDGETEISNTVLAGNIITTHEARISQNGFVGEGYLVIDVETGSGAYRISGGDNGSETKSDVLTAVGWVSTGLGFVANSAEIAAKLTILKSVLKPLFGSIGAILDIIGVVITAIDATRYCPGAAVAVWPAVALIAGLLVAITLAVSFLLTSPLGFMLGSVLLNAASAHASSSIAELAAFTCEDINNPG